LGEMTDIMVDTETTSVDPGHGAIIQLAAIKFNYDTEEIGPMFDRCPAMLPFRAWSESTREWWAKMPAVYSSIIARQENALPVFTDFGDWVTQDAPRGGYRFWAKPITFDWNFVSSHMEQCGLPMPFPFWKARDLNTFIAALHGGAEHVDQPELQFKGSQHNALHDNAHQIDKLFHAKRQFVHAEIIK
jgi:DNA polymerase III epsilon subunit-like protein